ncbi:hypothetical protein DQX05_22030 [Paenibacillus thiaminolyticus]|uniref:Type II toxin-antitoxin system RelE/ParE family toxin n=1 Tax=Paenibacillus thiaminolyticus TaxID=49283 RepID=A0A3A3GCI0_PANTH|nr:hypothetical protein DQX05_22030 [Paenibacillus thiaminolyticus]
MYKIEFVSKRVKKEIQSLNFNEQQIVSVILDALKKNDGNLVSEKLNKFPDIKRTKKHRVRIFYKIDNDHKRILIGKVCIRDSSSYNHDMREWFKHCA